MRALLLFVAACSGIGGSAGSSIAVCQDSCDDAAFFDCLSASEHTQCRTRCATTGPRARQNFVACQDVTLPACAPECYAFLGLDMGTGQ